MGESLMASGHLTYSQEYLKHKEALDYWKAWVLKDELKVTQSCPALCDPMVYAVHGIFQAGVLEWVAISFSRGSFQPRDWTKVSRTVGRSFYRLSHQRSLLNIQTDL